MPGYRWADIGKERLPIPIEKVDNAKQVIESSPMEYDSCCGTLVADFEEKDSVKIGECRVIRNTGPKPRRFKASDDNGFPIEVPNHLDFLRFSLEGSGVFSLILEGALYCNGKSFWSRIGGMDVIFDEPTKMTQPVYISKIPKFRLRTKCFEDGSLMVSYHSSNVCQVAEKQLGVKKDLIKFMDLTVQWKT